MSADWTFSIITDEWQAASHRGAVYDALPDSDSLEPKKEKAPLAEYAEYAELN